MRFPALIDDPNSRMPFPWLQQASVSLTYNSWNQFSTTDDNESIICFLNIFHRILSAFNALASFSTRRLVGSIVLGTASTLSTVPAWKEMDSKT